MDILVNCSGHKAYEIASANIGNWIVSAMLFLPVLYLNRLFTSAISKVIVCRILVNSYL